MGSLPKKAYQQQTEKSIFVEGVGEVQFRRSPRAKSLRLRVDPKSVSAILPLSYSESMALRFIEQKKSWIHKARKKQQAIGNAQTVFREDTVFHTRYHELQLLKHPKATIKSLVGRNKITVWYPDFAPIGDERIQQVIRKAVEEAWRAEAKAFLPKRVKELAIQSNFKYARVSIKNAKSRWGSCSSQNNLNLNVQLMRLPADLCDYVILHELVHTVHKHHQKSFWAALEKVLPGAKSLDRKLNAYNLRYW